MTKPSSLVLGFLVTDKDGKTLFQEPDDGLLMYASRKATVFPTREQAQRAARRTESHVRKNKYPWGQSHRIYRVYSPGR